MAADDWDVCRECEALRAENERLSQQLRANRLAARALVEFLHAHQDAFEWRVAGLDRITQEESEHGTRD